MTELTELQLAVLQRLAGGQHFTRYRLMQELSDDNTSHQAVQAAIEKLEHHGFVMQYSGLGGLTVCRTMRANEVADREPNSNNQYAYKAARDHELGVTGS